MKLVYPFDPVPSDPEYVRQNKIWGQQVVDAIFAVHDDAQQALARSDAGRVEFDRALPFRGENDIDNTQIIIGADREETFYRHSDVITVLYGPGGSNVQIIEKDVAESVNYGVETDGWVYYEIGGTAGSWTAALTFADAYPTDLNVMVGRLADGNWNQYLRTCPDIVAEFETSDGKVKVTSNDTTADFLYNKMDIDPDSTLANIITDEDSPLVYAEKDDAGNEDLFLGFDIENLTTEATPEGTTKLIVSSSTDRKSEWLDLYDLEVYLDFCDSVSFAVANEITWGFSGATVSETLTVDGVWLLLAANGANLEHGVTEEGGSHDWTSFTNGDGDTVYVDDTGHIQKIDTTSSPGGTTKYKYVNCVDAGQIHWSTAIRGADVVIEVAGGCWERVGEFVTADAEDWNPSVTASYASCSACETGADNYYIKKCSDDSLAFILAAEPTDDFFWGCISSAFAEVYWDGSKTSTSATSPTLLYLPCGSAPASCADLSTTVPADDDFSGSGCDSVSVGGDIWNFRWPDSVTGANNTQSITGGKLRQAVAGSAGGSNDCIARALTGISLAGTFTISVDFDAPSYSYGSNTEGWALFLPGITTTDIVYQYKADDTDGRYNGRVAGSEATAQINNVTSGKFRITRDGSNVIKTQYWNGSGWTTVKSGTLSGTVTGFRIYTFSSGGAFNLDWDNFTVTDGADGAGNTVYLDRSGGSC